MNHFSKLSEPSPVNRRKWPRYEVDWQFQMEGVDGNGRVFWADGTLHDISARGSSGYCFDPPENGTRVVVSIRMPFESDNWIRYIAEIVRIEESEEGTLVALQFVSSRPVFYSQKAQNKAVAHSPEDNLSKLDSKVIVTA